jgi:hypothetical protein
MPQRREVGVSVVVREGREGGVSVLVSADGLLLASGRALTFWNHQPRPCADAYAYAWECGYREQ